MSLKIHAWLSLIHHITLMNEIYQGYGSVIEAWFIDSPSNCMSRAGRLLVLPPTIDAGSKGKEREKDKITTKHKYNGYHDWSFNQIFLNT